MNLALRRWIVVIALGVMASLTSGGWAAAQAQGSKKVSVRLNWRIKGEFAPLYVAARLGFFAREGLAVDIREGRGTTEAILQVATGRDDFGYIPTPQAIRAVNEGIPVVMIATLATDTTMAWVAFDDIPLKHPRDVEGRSISIAAPSTFAQIWDVFARAHGIDIKKVRVVRPDPAARFGLFLKREVDILGDIFLSNEYPVLRGQTDRELTVLRMADWGFDLIGYGVLVHRDMLARDPETATRFLRGLIAGFEHTVKHQEEAAQLMSELFQDLKVPATLGQLKEVISHLTLDQARRVTGRVGAERWQASLKILHSAGYIDEILPLERYVNYEVLPAAR